MKNVKLHLMFRIILFILLSFSYVHSQTLSSSLTACYAFDGNGNEPITNSTATLGAVTSTVNRYNNPNTALYFSGTNSSIVRMPGNALLKPTSELSVSSWIKPTILPSGVGCYILFTKNTAGSNFEAYSITINNLGGGVSKFAALKGNAGFSSVCLSTTSIVPNNWYHVAMTMDNSTIKIYINGALESTLSTTLTFNYDTNHDVYFGGTNESYNLPFTGLIDNSRFYNRILSASEISQLYTTDPNCTETPGQAVNFDGGNDFVNPNFLVTTVSNNFTYELWARPTATHEIDPQTTSGVIDGLYNQKYLVWPTWRNSQGGIGISAGTNGISVYEHGSNFINSLLTYTGTINAWTHIAVVVTNKQPSLYLNGTLVQTGLTSTKTNVWPSLGECGQYTVAPNVGGIGGGSYGFFQGDVDEFRLWNSAITQTQIAAYMNTEFSCSMAGLMAYYKFNHGLAFSGNSTYSTATDYSGNNITATLTSMSLGGYTSNWIAPGASVTPSTSFTLNVSASSPSICSGQSATLTASGALTYTWMPGSSTNTTLITNPSATTIYTLYGTNSSSCTANKTISLVVYTVQALNVIFSSSAICAGNTATLSVTNASNCIWQPGNLSGTTVTVSPASSTIYTAVSTNSSGCSSSTTIPITVNPSVSLSISASATTICTGDQLFLSANGANNYTWQPGNLSTQNVTVSPGVSTVYTVTGTNTTGCSASLTVSINVSNAPVINALSSPTAICVGNSASLTATGASSYTWIPVNLTGSMVVVSPTSSTTYTLIGSNGSCTGSTSVFVGVTTSPFISASANPSLVCAGDPSTLTANGASSYTWYPGNFTGNTVVVNPGAPTVYTVIGGNGACTASATTTVNIGLLLNVTASGNLCNNALVDLYVSPTSTATSVSWNGPGIVGPSNTATISVNVGGVYTVVVTNTVTNCSGTGTINIYSTTNLFTITPIPSSTVACYPGPPINLLVNASANLSWFPASQVSPNTGALVSVSPSVTTTYTVIGTLGTCSSSAAITLSVNQTPTLSVSANDVTVCSLSSFTMSASGATDYLWLPGNLNGSTVSLVPYSPTLTTSVFTVTGYNGLCSNTHTYAVTVQPQPSVSAIASPASICIGNFSNLNALGALSYTWQSLSTTTSGASVMVNPTVTTIYSVSGTNSFGCKATSSVQLIVINSPAISASASDTEICAGDQVTLTANGASTYTWLPGFLIGATIVTTPSATVNYTVNSNNTTCSYATVLVTVINCVNNSLGITNAAGTPVPSASNYYKIHFTITAGNNANSDLQQVELKDDLKSTFPYPASFTVTNKPKINSITSSLQLNSNYNGVSDINLTLPASSSLPANKRDTISFDVLLEPNAFSGQAKNSVIGFALDKNNLTVSDSSNNGFSWDPDLDGNPTNNNLITTIEINPIELFIPEGFSPNNDGNNDRFIISGLNGKSISLFIYNRWGNKVYENSNYDNSWDGVSNAKGTLGKDKLPQSTYYYTIEFIDGSREGLSGFVVLEY